MNTAATFLSCKFCGAHYVSPRKVTGVYLMNFRYDVHLAAKPQSVFEALTASNGIADW